MWLVMLVPMPNALFPLVAYPNLRSIRGLNEYNVFVYDELKCLFYLLSI